MSLVDLKRLLLSVPHIFHARCELERFRNHQLLICIGRCRMKRFHSALLFWASIMRLSLVQRPQAATHEEL